MIGTRNHLALLGIGGLALFGATACDVSFETSADGSGVPETVTYDFDAFDEVDISGVFSADITIAEGPPAVAITIDDNLVDRLEVRVDNGELKVDMTRGNVNHDVSPTVVITVPSLTELDLSGASSATVDGLDEPELKLDVSGAADAGLFGDVTELDVDVSGASNVTFDGKIEQVTLDLSGAGSADFTDATVGVAKVDLSGASSTEFEVLDEVSGDLSGGSSLSIPSGADTSVETSGASQVDRS